MKDVDCGSNLIHFIGIVGTKVTNKNLNKKLFFDDVNFKYVNSIGLNMKLDFKNKDDKNANFEEFLKLLLPVSCHIDLQSSDDLVYSMLVNTKENAFVTRSSNVNNNHDTRITLNHNDYITMFVENAQCRYIRR